MIAMKSLQKKSSGTFWASIFETNFETSKETRGQNVPVITPAGPPQVVMAGSDPCKFDSIVKCLYIKLNIKNGRDFHIMVHRTRWGGYIIHPPCCGEKPKPIGSFPYFYFYFFKALMFLAMPACIRCVHFHYTHSSYLGHKTLLVKPTGL